MYPLRVTDRAQSVLVCITWQPGHLRSGIEYEYDDALQQHFLKSLQPVSQAQNGHSVGARRYLTDVRTGVMMNGMQVCLKQKDHISASYDPCSPLPLDP